MSNLIFDESLALSLHQSSEQFPINIDDAWRWLGYKNKRNCVDTLKDGFIINLDFLIGKSKSTGGRPSEVLLLSIECFKMLGMLAGTEQGKIICKYFLECERIAKASTTKTLSLSTPSRLTELQAEEIITRDNIARLEAELRLEQVRLQDILKQQLIEAKAFNESNPGIMQQAIAVARILDKAKANNKYLSM
ncbi:MAG: hypothetical protein RMY36_010240 [Nostoc sp. SerVER01]|nr:hypothetical protein [Nostoc sp. SerVER01]